MSSNTAFNGGAGSMQDGLGLNLELGGDYYHSSTSSTTWSGFTFPQLQELELQNHIYKYMEAGLPIPYQLIFPIWKSVINSLGCSTSKMQQYFNNSGPGDGGWVLDMKKSMDPEPERCRRTDGKKWRCSKEVVPNHKYCEKHVHRGRPRSRKHVENSAQP